MITFDSSHTTSEGSRNSSWSGVSRSAFTPKVPRVFWMSKGFKMLLTVAFVFDGFFAWGDEGNRYLSMGSNLNQKAESKIDPKKSKKIQIAYLAGFTGRDPHTANELYRGIEVFFAEHPDAKSRFSVEKIDTASTISGALQAVNRAKEIGSQLLIGLHNSDEAIVAAKLVEHTSQLLFAPFASHPKVTLGMSHTFRFCFNDHQQGELLAQFAVQKLKTKKVAVLSNSDSIYSVFLSQVISEQLKKNPKLLVVSDLMYSNSDLKQSEFDSVLRKLDPDLIVIPDYITRASMQMKYWHKELPKARFLGGDGFGGKKMFQEVMGPIEGLEVYYSTHWHEDVPTSRGKKFAQKYRTLYPTEDPTSGAAMTYDAIEIFDRTLALEKMNSSNWDADRLGKRLKKIRFQSTLGEVSFAKNDNSPQKPLVIVRYVNGRHEFEEVFPKQMHEFSYGK